MQFKIWKNFEKKGFPGHEVKNTEKLKSFEREDVSPSTTSPVGG